MQTTRPFDAPPPAAAPRRARPAAGSDAEKHARTTTGTHTLARDEAFADLDDNASQSSRQRWGDPGSYAANDFGSYAGTPPPTPPAGADIRAAREGRSPYHFGAPRGKRNATLLPMDRSTPLPEPDQKRHAFA